MFEDFGTGKTKRLEATVFREALSGEEPKALFDYWNARRGDRTMPARSEIDPVDMPPTILPCLYILAAECDGQLRFRLSGTRLIEVFGRDPSGKILDEVLEDQDLVNARRSYRKVMETAQPWYSCVTYRVHEGGDFLYQRLSLPLGEPDGMPNRILGGLFVERDENLYEDFGKIHHRRGLTPITRIEAVMV